jgi:hypothetical protein
MTTIIDGSAGITFPAGGNPQAAPAGVIQVVNATYSTETSSSSSTFADTGLTATITPKFSTSKILVLVDVVSCGKSSSSTSLSLRVVRNSTTIVLFDTNAGYTNSTANNYIGACSTNYLDSPATTSATTYKVQFASNANAGFVFISSASGVGNPSSTITLMEIAQ